MIRLVECVLFLLELTGLEDFNGHFGRKVVDDYLRPYFRQPRLPDFLLSNA
jgi:hypothetical protein